MTNMAKLFKNLFLEETKFSDLYCKIIAEEELSQAPAEDSPKKYENMSIAVVPGSFKPPHKGHWEMVMKALKSSDKTIVLVSNISEKANLSRTLSMSNLKPLWKAKDLWETNCKDSLPMLEDAFTSLADKADSLSYYDAEEKLKDSLDSIDTESLGKKEKKVVESLEKWLSSLKKDLTKSIRRTSTGKEITPEIAVEIFKIYAKAYNVPQEAIEIKASESASPVKDFFYVLKDCKNCDVKLVTSDKGEDATRFDHLFDNPPEDATNRCSVMPVAVQTMISATDIRENLDQISRDWFPKDISDEDFEKIKELLQ